MAPALVIGFLLAAAVVAWAVVNAVSGRATRWVRVLYLVCFLAAAIAAYFTTFHCIYYANANTRVHGLPIPTVVFQRHDSSAPWLDFVGPAVFLAYPMNLILYALLPSVVVLVLARRFPSRTQPNDA